MLAQLDTTLGIPKVSQSNESGWRQRSLQAKMRRTLEDSRDHFRSDGPDTVFYNGWPRRLAA
jgi:hypothetical protein